MGEETLAFANAFDCAFALRSDVEKMLQRRIPISFLTDSESLFEIITKSSSTLEKRLMIDIAAAREAYSAEVLSDFGMIRSEHNPADAFMKEAPKAQQMLNNVLSTGMLNHLIEQSIHR